VTLGPLPTRIEASADVCGIFGIVDRRGLRASDPEILTTLGSCLRHRGPDGGNGVVSDRCAIGMRRLAIIDTAGGMQPLWNERRTIALVANGEIYNFVERRKELESRGHRFGTASDCEVIIHLYEEFGTEGLQYLRGMFAFALVDFEKRRVLIARDRIGEKPLYLAEQGDRIVFASELQSLIAAGIVPFALNDIAISDYFLWGYVPEPESPVVGTRKLPAGHFLDISLEDWSVRESRWWSPLDAPEVQGDPRERISEMLHEIGRLTVRADVPVGVALSGGLDSSALASLACENASGSVHTFTVGYEGGGRHDESELAASFASRLGTQHHRTLVEDAWVVKEFPRMCLARDEPISDISGLGYLAVSRAAGEAGVPVLLLGHGSDELFWGYPWSAPAVRANLRKEKLLAGSAGLGTYLRVQRPPVSYSGLVTWALQAGGLCSGLDAWQRDRASPRGQMVFFDQRPEWSAAAGGLDRIASPGFLERVGSALPERHFTFSAIPHRPDLEMTDLLLRTYLLSNGINQSDRLSMAESVECRLPLVDYRLVETVIGLRRRIEDWRLPPKAWLRDALGDLLPKEVADRPKRGFTPPWRRWSAAIFREHGGALVDGFLSDMDVLRPMDSGLSPLDRFGRASAVALPALTLELWAKGMHDLERSRTSGRTGPDLAAWTKEAVRRA